MQIGLAQQGKMKIPKAEISNVFEQIHVLTLLFNQFKSFQAQKIQI